jgi:hypothetical protein
MEQHEIAAAGPFLVLRMQDKTFLKLPLEERQQSLQTLSKLRPKRCEEVCITLLKTSKLFQPSSLETTRELAARFLAEVASTDGALHLLAEVANSKPWRNSKGVREASTAALARLHARVEERLVRNMVEGTKAEGEGAARIGNTTVSKKVRKPQAAKTTGSGKTAATGAGKTGTGAPKRKTNPGTAAEGSPSADEAPAAPNATKTTMRKRRPAEPAGQDPQTDDKPDGRASTAAGE